MRKRKYFLSLRDEAEVFHVFLKYQIFDFDYEGAKNKQHPR